jgi:uncharacterized protein YdaU (DUF1376 family)
VNFYPFHLGDYAAHTRHLSLMEDLAYRRMLDLYYTSESPLPAEPEKVARLIGMREYMQEVSDVLSDFFVKSDAGYTNARCDKEIETYRAKAERAKQANLARWGGGKESPDLKSDVKSDAGDIPTNTNTNPITNTNPKAKSKPKTATASRLPDDLAEDFEVIWAAYPRKPGMSRSNTEKVFAARIAEGAKPPTMLAGVQAYAAYVVAMGTEPQFIKSPETFFGPGKHWESDWTPQPRASPRQTQNDNKQRLLDRINGTRSHDYEPRIIDINDCPA